MISLFKDKQLQKEFEELGYVKISLLEMDDVLELKSYYKEYSVNQDEKVVCTFKRQILIPFEGHAVEDKIKNY